MKKTMRLFTPIVSAGLALLVLAAFASPSSGADKAVGKTPKETPDRKAAKDKPAPRPLFRWDKELRIGIRSVGRLLDSDGDGVCDVDEIALGTDPRKPLDVPSVTAQLDAIAARKLTTFDKGLQVVTVLPVVFPNGESMASKDGKFGLTAQIFANLKWPNRKARLEGLGLTHSMLKGLGLDDDHGITIASSLLPGGGQKVTTANGWEVAVAAIRSALESVSAGDSLTSIPIASASNFSDAKATTASNVGGAYRQNYEGGYYSETTHKNEGASETTYITPTGKLVTVTNAFTWSETNRDRSTTTHHQNISRTYNTDGSITTHATDIGDTKDAKGKTTGFHAKDTSGTDRADGSNEDDTTSFWEVKNDDGSVTRYTATTHVERDKNGKPTSETTTTESQVTDAKGNKEPKKVTCKGDDCPQSDYINPDADLNTVTLTPELMERVIRKLGQTTTPFGIDEPGEVDVPKDFLGDPKGTAPLVFIDPDGNILGLLFTPHFFNSAKGTENYGPNGGGGDRGGAPSEPNAGVVFTNSYVSRFP